MVVRLGLVCLPRNTPILIRFISNTYRSMSSPASSTMEAKQFRTLSEMTHEELCEEVLKLRTTNENLTYALKKRNEDETSNTRRKHVFDFKTARKRHILLWISYLGWSFEGLVSQTSTTNSVEDILLKSLKKINLVEDVNNMNYTRCGRTDKGVSAFSQVLALDVRSIQPFDHSPLTSPELPYCAMLNRVFPPDLRAIAWRPAPENYSARFECIKRSYKYFFPKGDLNIEAMQKACSYLEGTHDFRNLCKMDVGNGVVKFVRTVDSAKIDEFEYQKDLHNSAFNMYCFTIQSGGFLYHQIRCIMHILFLIGEGNEEPEVINELLDIEKNPRKPQYSPAHELPLNLFSVEYPENGFDWVFVEEQTQKLYRDILDGWTIEACKTAMLRSMVNEIAKLKPVESQGWQPDILKRGSKGKHHPLMGRQKGSSVEEKINHFVEKRKIKVVQNEEDDETHVVKLPKLRIDVSAFEDQKRAALRELSETIDQVVEAKEKERARLEPHEGESGSKN